MDRRAWQATVHRVARVGHDRSDLACMQCFVISKLFSTKIEGEVMELGVGRRGVWGREESLINH